METSVRKSEHAASYWLPFEGIGSGDLISSLGKPSFERQLCQCLGRAYNAEWMHIFRPPAVGLDHVVSLADDGSATAEFQSASYFSNNIRQFERPMSKLWQSELEPLLNVVNRQVADGPDMLRFDIRKPESRQVANFCEAFGIGERIVVVGEGSEGNLTLVMIRSIKRGPFSQHECFKLPWLPTVAFPLLVRHYALASENKNSSDPLASLLSIESCLFNAPHRIPRRELQIVARILHGLSAREIAQDLGISSETVSSYRRRFYNRFEIGGFRELLIWYLDLFGRNCKSALNRDPAR